MKKVICLMIVSLFASTLAFAQETEIRVGKGILKIGGILQAGYTFHVEDTEGDDSFYLKRARLLLWGTIVPDKVKYFVQTEHVGSPTILDFKARFFYIPETEITVGRFLPNFTLYMPYSTGTLEMINYPMTTTKFAVWRQPGIQVTSKTEYVDFDVGVFNGGDVPNSWADNNDMKDILFRADIKPPIEQAELRIGGYAWVGFAEPPAMFDTLAVVNPEEETLKMNRFGGFAKLDYTRDQMTFRVRGEVVAGQAEVLTGATTDGLTTNVSDVETINAIAYFGHVGVQPVPEIELLFRYEAYDPNTDAEDDMMSAVTGGINYYIEGLNSMIYLNYIHNMEQGVEKDNDVVMAQVQILF